MSHPAVSSARAPPAQGGQPEPDHRLQWRREVRDQCIVEGAPHQFGKGEYDDADHGDEPPAAGRGREEGDPGGKNEIGGAHHTTSAGAQVSLATCRPSADRHLQDDDEGGVHGEHRAGETGRAGVRGIQGEHREQLGIGDPGERGGRHEGQEGRPSHRLGDVLSQFASEHAVVSHVSWSQVARRSGPSRHLDRRQSGRARYPRLAGRPADLLLGVLP